MSKLGLMLAVFGLMAGFGCGGEGVGRQVGADGGKDDVLADGTARTCSYRGKVYRDQEQWQDGCNSCKCNPEGSTGPGCTARLCSDGQAHDDAWRADSGVPDSRVLDSVSPFFSCAKTLCIRGSQVCVHPCCGGARPQCLPKPDAGPCPEGTREGCSSGEAGCETTCTPDPPYCTETAPAGCDSLQGVADQQHAFCLCA